MVTSTKRFKILDGETNTPVMDFFNTTDSQIVNKDRTNAKINIIDLENINNVASNKNIPDSYKLASVINSSNNVLAGADQAIRDSLVDLMAVSPAYADIMRKLGYGPGTSELRAAIPQLLKQIANNDVLSNAASKVRGFTSGLGGGGMHLPDFTGIFSGVPNIGDKLDKLKAYAHFPHLSTNTLEAIHRLTRNPALQKAVKGAGIVALSGLTIGRLQQLLFPHPTPAANVVNNLPPAIKERVLTEVVNNPSAPNTVIINPVGPNTPVSTNPDAGGFIGGVNKLVPGLVPVPVTLPEVNARLITVIVTVGAELGLTNIFTGISNVINDPVATVAAGVVITNAAAANGDINIVLDVANSPYASTIGGVLPNLANDILRNLTLPSNATQAELLSISGKLIIALDILSPNWRTQTYNNLAGLTVQELSVVNLIMEQVNGNISAVTKMLSIVASNTTVIVPDLIVTPASVVPVVSTLDQWTYWASTYLPTTVRESVKQIIPVPPFILN